MSAIVLYIAFPELDAPPRSMRWTVASRTRRLFLATTKTAQHQHTTHNTHSAPAHSAAAFFRAERERERNGKESRQEKQAQKYLNAPRMDGTAQNMTGVIYTVVCRGTSSRALPSQLMHIFRHDRSTVIMHYLSRLSAQR